jgi:hypothetical protein
MSYPAIPLVYGSSFYPAAQKALYNIRPAQRSTPRNPRVVPLLLHPEEQQPVDEILVYHRIREIYSRDPIFDLVD